MAERTDLFEELCVETMFTVDDINSALPIIRNIP